MSIHEILAIVHNPDLLGISINYTDLYPVVIHEQIPYHGNQHIADPLPDSCGSFSTVLMSYDPSTDP